MSQYLFKSTRLGFRAWHDADLEPLLTINTDPEVMKYFPYISDKPTTLAFIRRMKAQYEEHGYCYFAIELLSSSTFIGFIGLSYQEIDVGWAPYTDVGWRLAKEFWGKGYATEGAKNALEFGFRQLGIHEIYSTAPLVNTPSIEVMKRIGMQKVGQFKHPKLADYPFLEDCALFKISS